MKTEADSSDARCLQRLEDTGDGPKPHPHDSTLGVQAWAQSTCPELSPQGLVPLRWGCKQGSIQVSGSQGSLLNSQLLAE